MSLAMRQFKFFPKKNWGHFLRFQQKSKTTHFAFIYSSAQNSLLGLWTPTLGQNLKIRNLDAPTLACEPTKSHFNSCAGRDEFFYTGCKNRASLNFLILLFFVYTRRTSLSMSEPRCD
jgi:hypothetical protein